MFTIGSKPTIPGPLARRIRQVAALYPYRCVMCGCGLRAVDVYLAAVGPAGADVPIAHLCERCAVELSTRLYGPQVDRGGQ